MGKWKNSEKHRKFIGSSLLLAFIILLEMNLVVHAFSSVMLHRNSEIVFRTILQNEQQDLRSSVNNTIRDVERERAELKQLGMTEGEIRKVVRNHLSQKIHADRFSDGQYMWVNQIIDYRGGDRYAIRLIHPNLRRTEGAYLSTKTKDVMGNTPYADELRIIKKSGGGFHRYYFKNLDNNEVTEKVAYSRLYRPYNWVISAGENLDGIRSYERQQKEIIAPYLHRVGLSLSGILAVITLLTTVFYTMRFNRILVGKNEELKTTAYHDALTGIYNRGGLIAHLDEWIEDTRTGGMTGAFLDLDDFKLINDLYGHPAGDAALCRLTNFLQQRFPDGLIGRTGGDEFCVILREGSPEERSERIREAAKVVQEFTYRGDRIRYSVSVGYADFPSQAETRDEFMRIMDNALYAAKEGRDHEAVRFHPSLAHIKREHLGFSVKIMAFGMPGSFLVYRAEGEEQILFANDHLIDLFECSDYEDFLEYTHGSFRHIVHPEDLERVEETIRSQIHEGRNQAPDQETGFEDYVEYRILTKMGKEKRVIDMGRLVHDEHYGEIYYVFLQNVDTLKRISEEDSRWL